MSQIIKISDGIVFIFFTVYFILFPVRECSCFLHTARSSNGRKCSRSSVSYDL